MSHSGRESVRTKPASTWGGILAGALLEFIGGASLTAGLDWATVVGLVLIGVGTILILVGAVAAGVRLGMDWAAYDRGE